MICPYFKGFLFLDGFRCALTCKLENAIKYALGWYVEDLAVPAGIRMNIALC